MTQDLHAFSAAPSELPPATMETLMVQLGSAKPNTAIVGSATAAHEEAAPITEVIPSAQST